MNFSQFLLALRARYKILLLILVVTVAATITISMMLPKTYTAATSLVVNYKGADAVTGMSMPAQLMPGYLATQVDIIQSTSVALKVVDDLKLADSPAIQEQFRAATDGQGTVRDWLASLLLAKIDVLPARESSVLTIAFKGVDPQFVATVANAFAAAYLQISVQLKTDPAVQASGFITGQTKVLREQYEQAQARLSKYQQDNSIYSADDRLDIETTRLNELSSQLVVAQSAAIEAGSRDRQAQGNAGVSPDVLASGLIQGLKANLAAAESKFADTQQRLAPNHPQYIAAKAEVDKMRSTLNEQIAIASSGVASTNRISQQREGELRAALTAQKTKVQALNGARDEFNVLTNEMENARKAYEVASQRFNVTNLESQSKQADIAVLSAATAPLAPSGPRTKLNTLMAIVVGTILGVGAVLMLELLDQRVRSAHHLHDAFGLPVLGVIEKSRTLPHKTSYKALPHPGDGGPGGSTPALSA